MRDKALEQIVLKTRSMTRLKAFAFELPVHFPFLDFRFCQDDTSELSRLTMHPFGEPENALTVSVTGHGLRTQYVIEQGDMKRPDLGKRAALAFIRNYYEAHVAVSPPDHTFKP